jgi:hypothetical protein
MEEKTDQSWRIANQLTVGKVKTRETATSATNAELMYFTHNQFHMLWDYLYWGKNG